MQKQKGNRNVTQQEKQHMCPNAERSIEKENNGEEEAEGRNGPNEGQTMQEKRAQDPMDTDVALEFECL